MLPIVKVKPDTVTITSYYCKLFITRSSNNVANYAKFITKVIAVRANNPDDPSVTNLTYHRSTPNVKLPRTYTALSDTIAKFYTPQYKFFWNYNRLDKNFSSEELNMLNSVHLIPCGRVVQSDDTVLGMDSNGIIYNVINREKHTLGSLPYLIDSKIGEGPVEYTEISIFSKRIPLVLVLAYIYGLDNLLNKVGIPFKLASIAEKPPTGTGIMTLKFKDIIYVLDVSDKRNRLLAGGFNVIRNDMVNFKGNSLNNQQVYKSLLSGLGVTQYYLRELKLMMEMFVDPITMGILKELKEPTSLYGLLIKANSLLTNDYVPAVVNIRYKGYERIVGMVYHQMINAMRGYKQNIASNAQVLMNPNAVWLDIVQDQTITIVEESNPLQNLKEKESVTHSGSGGRSSVTMVKNTRGFGLDDVGVISESSPDSAKVGVRVFMTANPNLTTVRGTTRKFDLTTDGPTNVLSTTAMISPAVTHDDNM